LERFYEETDIGECDIVSYIHSDEPPISDVLAETIFAIIKFHIDGQHQKEWFLGDDCRLDIVLKDYNPKKIRKSPLSSIY